MTRAEYIEAVKVKLEEISPFEEPSTFIAAEGDTDYANAVKPIKSYIDESLDESTKNCLRTLPLSLLSEDIEKTRLHMTIDKEGVGTVVVSDIKNKRVVRFSHVDLARDITTFITPEDPIYLLQQNKYTRGGTVKPVAVVSGIIDGDVQGGLEIYSLKYNPPSGTAAGASYIETSWNGNIYYIDLTSHPGSDDASPRVISPIEEYIVLECAAIVSEILSDANRAQLFRNEIIAKLQAVLK